ncbi:hypothetical protein CEUSTIGMA_g6119.t1 [Chlamydomonas eustigma]|uniref:Uncharacterized protein n=1 Tax=Chlamydomonas eustigma TaxID=1157962 RepID=A0A250X6H1_9CHLO|nr:hypothetical protein CEUSTIGMA_g6119.t1 [Chlamydomonas eustigma]|eukprot:GAX78681.1 hypothetical protein CEUSTIGMA_g6119.t1 [Chlamydomonas eustigma]
MISWIEVGTWVPFSEGWQDRIKEKVGLTALWQEAYSKNRSFFEEVPRKVVGYSSGAALFCMVQEGLRALRGTQDPINSLIAGAVAGGVLAGVYQGPQFRLLGGALWGPISCLVHVLNNQFQPRMYMEDILITEGLLDPSVQERRHRNAFFLQTKRADELYRKALQVSSMDNLVEEATRVRDRELHQLWRMTANSITPADNGVTGPAVESTTSAYSAVVRQSPAAPASSDQKAMKPNESSKADSRGRQSSSSRIPTEVTGNDHAATSIMKQRQDDAEEEEFDEADFKSWMAAVRSAGGVQAPVIALDDDNDGHGSSGGGFNADHGSQRSWSEWARSFFRKSAAG